MTVGLGTGVVANQKREYCKFSDARRYARSLKLQSMSEWLAYHKSGKLPDDMPRIPSAPYKKEWKGWGDWLGTGYIANRDRKYLSPIEAKIEARKIAKKLGIKTREEWVAAHNAGKIPANLPRYPHDIYNPKRGRK